MVTRIETARAVARALVKISAVGVNIEHPVTFKSKLISPVYIDNRIIPYHPVEFEIIVTAFGQLAEELGIDFDVIAGVAAGGIPYSATLGYVLKKPSVFIRKEEKDHGLKKRVEGGDVTNRQVLLVEDNVTTFGSAVTAIEELRKAGGKVNACLAITTFGFAEATDASVAAGVSLSTLTEFTYILDAMMDQQLLNPIQRKIVDEWFDDPHGWAGMQEFHDRNH